MGSAVLFCPACVVPVPETHVEWEAIRATCARCELVLVLDGDIIPQAPIPAYPERLIQHRSPRAPRGWRVARDGATTRASPPGLRATLTGRRLVVSPAGFALEGLMVRGGVRLELVRGFVPVQSVRWVVRQQTAFQSSEVRRAEVDARTALVTVDDTWRTVAEHPTMHTALDVASLLNEAVELARHAGAPYRR